MAVGSMTPPPFFCITKSEVKRMTDFLISSTVCYNRVGDKVKAFNPASFLNPSNSRGLKFGL